MEHQLVSLARRVGSALRDQGKQVATAESCTGGWMAEVITAVPGSSYWFERGFITYSDAAKRDMLGVAESTLADHGAVSGEAVREMAEGALAHSQAQLSVAISGVAGPAGGTPEKPVGTVWLAWAGEGPTVTQLAALSGSREAVRRQAVAAALRGLLRRLGVSG